MNSRQTSYQNNFWSEIAARKHKGVWLRKHFLMGFTTIYRARFSSFFHLHTRFTWSIWTQAMVLLLHGDLLGNGSTLRRNFTMQNLKLKKKSDVGPRLFAICLLVKWHAWQASREFSVKCKCSMQCLHQSISSLLHPVVHKYLIENQWHCMAGEALRSNIITAGKKLVVQRYYSEMSRWARLGRCSICIKHHACWPFKTLSLCCI
jgi:hypothetical protein